MKNFLLRCVSLLLFTVITPGLLARAATFSDVPENSEHFAAVEYLKEKGIVSGYPDATFQPEKMINRAEALKILFLSAKTPLGDPGKNASTIPFSDVKKTDWFFDYVSQGFSSKFIQGYPDKTFRPENTINLAESLRLIFQVLGPDIPANLSVNVTPYPDVDKNSWYATAASAAKTRNFISAREDGKLHPEREISREEFSEMVYRFLYIRENKIGQFPLYLHWPKYIHPSDHYSLQYPFDWQKIEAGAQMIFWKRDSANGQVSFSRIFPNSATVIAAVDPNTEGKTLDDYLAKIQYDSEAVIQKQTLRDYASVNVIIANNGLRDFYILLPNKTILILYSQSGDGVLKSDLQNILSAIAESVRYEEKSQSDVVPSTPTLSPKEKVLSTIRMNLLLKDQGKAMLDILKDTVIIETDTIGIGTGPVDYYYSAEYQVTLKYERGTDRLLAMKDGKTSAF